MFISTTSTRFTLSAAFAMRAPGNGESVIGRIRPALIPSCLAMFTAVFAILAAVPKATTAICASSIMSVSHITSRSAIRSYFAFNL